MMRAYAATVTIGMAIATAAAAPQDTTTLPDVTVTAPANIPPDANSYTAGGNPYFGKTRVDEASWPSIPCASSRVAAGVTGDCRRGPTVINFEHGDAQGTRALSNCQIAHDLVISSVAGVPFEADSLVFDPYYVSALGHQRQDCYVEARPATLQAQLVDMNHVTRQATQWGPMQQNGDLTTMEFAVGPDHCVAFEKRGPRWGGGYIYLVHAATCRKDGRPVDPSNIAAVLGALHIEQRDPTGNLHQ
ncbi:MAG: hypothetical protein JO032_08685 [Alphaproteobacteria bacterium]|nr:hypothetical protein [Alphaproteobacteria bacterium]